MRSKTHQVLMLFLLIAALGCAEYNSVDMRCENLGVSVDDAGQRLSSGFDGVAGKISTRGSCGGKGALAKTEKGFVTRGPDWGACQTSDAVK